MSGLTLVQCGKIARGADREATYTMLYDLFNYGFMAGYKQSKAEQKAKPEPEQTVEEKKAMEYRCNITKIIQAIENVDILMKIYTFDLPRHTLKLCVRKKVRHEKRIYQENS